LFNKDNPFIELKFHYNLGGKTYLSPDTFNKPDPIVEFANRLKKSGDKDDWQFGRKMEPKMRTFCPVIVRGKEKEGVKFWGFGKQVYQSILSYIADPDYGDITDPLTGRDIVVEFTPAEQTGKNFPETTIRPKPNQTPAVDDSLKEVLTEQTDILELFEEPTYADLKVSMDAWLNEENEADAVAATEALAATEPPVSAVLASPEATAALLEQPVSTEAPKVSPKDNMDSVMKEFDELFDDKK
jgi:hypothetical protein